MLQCIWGSLPGSHLGARLCDRRAPMLVGPLYTDTSHAASYQGAAADRLYGGGGGGGKGWSHAIIIMIIVIGRSRLHPNWPV